MALGDRIKEARKRCGITQLDLSKALGVAKSTVAGWEKNHEPTVAQVGQIADFLGVDANYLLQDEIKSRYERAASPDEMERLVKRFRALDEHGKDMIMRVMDGEEARIETEHTKAEIVPMARKTIPLLHDVAAGPTDVFGEIMDEYEIDANSPANFAIQISGDSMEPFLPDGSVQLGVMGKGLETGDIGVFMLDGGLLCKQYVKDNYGNVYLNSLNRDRSENDVAIFSSGNRRIDCVGKVLVKEKIPVQM